MPAADLQAAATTWGQELAAAGVTLNLAPVVDIPTEQGAASNAPIGHYQREFGYDLSTVTTHADAFAAGMAAAGVDTAVKHFPGLGRVTGDTDTDRERHRRPHEPVVGPGRVVPARRRPRDAVRHGVDGDLRAHRPDRARRRSRPSSSTACCATPSASAAS